MKKIVFILLSVFLFSCSKNSDLEFKAKELVTQQLKSPSSAEFIETTVLRKNKNNPDQYLVKVVVDADNAFGAKIRNTFLVALMIEGDNVKWFPDKAVQLVSNEPTEAEMLKVARLNNW